MTTTPYTPDEIESISALEREWHDLWQRYVLTGRIVPQRGEMPFHWVAARAWDDVAVEIAKDMTVVSGDLICAQLAKEMEPEPAGRDWNTTLFWLGSLVVAFLFGWLM